MMHTQRWRERKSVFRRKAQDFSAKAFDVALIPDDKTARAFVEQHHYSASFPAAQEKFGLYQGSELVGVAVYGRSARDAVLTNVFDGPVDRLRELSRLVLLDEVPYNAESWFISHSMKCLRSVGITGVLSFSDPIPRSTLEGEVVMPGHVGTVYQATNATYLARGTPRTLKLLPDATVLSDRGIQKIRAGESGWRGQVRLLEKFGADPLDPEADGPTRVEWLSRWVGLLTRTMRHTGNYRYAWSFGSAFRMAAIPQYPKKSA
jgi:hypothetical protein